jgi:hypothetical protein
MSELQTAEETQQYGQAGIEQAQGYEPLHPPSLPEDVGLDDRSAQIKAGVKEIVSRRSKPEEYTPPISVRAYSDQQGNRLTEDDQNPKETVTLAEAATDLATMRVREENQAELDEREALAREIDALRNGVTTVQLNAEPPPVVDQPQPVQPQLSPDEIVANKLRESPELLAAMQQSIANEQAKLRRRNMLMPLPSNTTPRRPRPTCSKIIPSLPSSMM